MTRSNGWTGLVLVVVFAAPLSAQEVGALHRITGCENGELVVPRPNVWSSPQRLLGPQPTVVGQLTGGSPGRRVQCRGGDVVRVLERTTYEGRPVYRIVAVVNGLEGWITPGFIGPEFPVGRCEQVFDGPEQLQRCREGRR